MDAPHPQDKLAALDWAIQQAERAGDDPMAKLNLAVLRALRDEAKREAGR